MSKNNEQTKYSPSGVTKDLKIQVPSGTTGTSVPTPVRPTASGTGVNPFIEDMDAAASISLGENGCPEWTVEGIGDPRVAFFFKLVRGLTQEESNTLIDNIIGVAQTKSDVQGLVDLFCLMWQTRDIRGGKGEKELFYNFFMKMYEQFPRTCLHQLTLISHFGYWKDCLALLAKSHESYGGIDYAPLVSAIYALMATQFKKDLKALEKSMKDMTTPSLSLLGKWLPRQGKAFDRKLGFCLRFVGVLGLINTGSPTNVRWALGQYRKKCSELNKALDVPEVLMTAKRWAEINFGNVASRCMLKCRKAFLNELCKTIPEPEHEATGNRHPDDPDRVACRANLVKVLIEKGVHGKVLMPHEIVTKICPNASISTVEKVILQKQWESILSGVRENMEAITETVGAAASGAGTGTPTINLGNLVPLVDVSGSMNGTPMEVAIAMGLVVSEMANPAFRHCFLTFSEMPTWVNVADCPDICSKVMKTRRAHWGYNTNFERAMHLICDVVRANRLSADQVPDLIVFSDMQFDEARNSRQPWATMHETIVQMFADVGREISGEPYDPPTITYWNLRSDTVGFPAQADTPGVRMISGFSPALLKLVLSGEPMETEETVVDEATGEMVTRTRRDTPYETFRKAMDDPLYDPVRVSIREVGEVADMISGDLRRFTIRRQPSFVGGAAGAASGAASGSGV